uniref:CCR4-NOT transcription complex subunit 11 n=1 Tax=Macrostomum lignano TaxID=282301 RepID=A0A1I8IKI9_9PLAT
IANSVFPPNVIPSELDLSFLESPYAERAKEMPVVSRVAMPCVLSDPERRLASMESYSGSGSSAEAQRQVLDSLLTGDQAAVRSHLRPEFLLLAPPLHSVGIEDELVWMSPTGLEHTAQWDASMCQSGSSGAETRKLMVRAFKQTLQQSQIRQLNEAISQDPKLISLSGMSPSRLPELVEHNPLVAIELAQVTDYFSVLVNMEMSLHSMEVVNRLTTSVELPAEFIHLYISNCISSCESTKDKYMQNRLVRLVCVFLQSLIRNKIIDVKNIYIEVQAFCIEFNRIREAAGLFRLLKSLESSDGSVDSAAASAALAAGGGGPGSNPPSAATTPSKPPGGQQQAGIQSSAEHPPKQASLRRVQIVWRLGGVQPLSHRRHPAKSTAGRGGGCGGGCHPGKVRPGPGLNVAAFGDKGAAIPAQAAQARQLHSAAGGGRRNVKIPAFSSSCWADSVAPLLLHRGPPLIVSSEPVASAAAAIPSRAARRCCMAASSPGSTPAPATPAVAPERMACSSRSFCCSSSTQRVLCVSIEALAASASTVRPGRDACGGLLGALLNCGSLHGAVLARRCALLLLLLLEQLTVDVISPSMIPQLSLTLLPRVSTARRCCISELELPLLAAAMIDSVHASSASSASASSLASSSSSSSRVSSSSADDSSSSTSASSLSHPIAATAGQQRRRGLLNILVWLAGLAENRPHPLVDGPVHRAPASGQIRRRLRRSSDGARGQRVDHERIGRLPVRRLRFYWLLLLLLLLLLLRLYKPVKLLARNPQQFVSSEIQANLGDKLRSDVESLMEHPHLRKMVRELQAERPESATQTRHAGPDDGVAVAESPTKSSTMLVQLMHNDQMVTVIDDEQLINDLFKLSSGSDEDTSRTA